MIESDTTNDREEALILQTHSIEEPRRTYAPLFFAMTATAMEMETTMWYTMEGTSQLEEGAPETVQLDEGSDVTLKTMLDRAMNTGVDILACQQSMDLFDLEEDDLMEGVEIVGAASFIDMSLEADLVMYF